MKSHGGAGVLAKALARDVHWDPSQGKGAAEQVLVRAGLEESWGLFPWCRVTYLDDRSTRRLTWLSG